MVGIRIASVAVTGTVIRVVAAIRRVRTAATNAPRRDVRTERTASGGMSARASGGTTAVKVVRGLDAENRAGMTTVTETGGTSARPHGAGSVSTIIGGLPVKNHGETTETGVGQRGEVPTRAPTVISVCRAANAAAAAAAGVGVAKVPLPRARGRAPVPRPRPKRAAHGSPRNTKS